MTEIEKTSSQAAGAQFAIVVMGVSGCGKSTFGRALATELGFRFIEGDRLHPPANVARMAGGQPLTDRDREGWLDAIGHQVADSANGGQGVIAACSALKRSYRDRLRDLCGPVLFVLLDVDRNTAFERVSSRVGHFMPARLVESQFADLDPPHPDEQSLILDGSRPVKSLVAEARTRIPAHPIANLQS